MGIIKNPQSQSINQAITKVIQTQRALAIRHYHPDLMSYLDRPTWQQTARALVEQYWPRTVSKDLYIQGEIESLYGVALILGPLSGQCAGFWNPWRHKGHLTSWFRQYVQGQQKFWLGVHWWDWEKQYAEFSSSVRAFGVPDREFAEHCQQLILNNAFAESLRGQFARKVFAPLLLHERAKEIYHRAKAKNAVFWWDERHALVLSKTPYCLENGAWFDLSQSPVDVWNYEVRAKYETIKCDSTDEPKQVKKNSKKQHKRLMLYMYLNDVFLKKSMDNIKNILISKTTDQAKVFLTSSELRKVYSSGKFCFQAQPQCNTFGKNVLKKIEKQIFHKSPDLHKLYFNIMNQKWDIGFYPRNSSGLLDKKLTLEEWMKWWRPWR